MVTHAFAYQGVIGGMYLEAAVLIGNGNWCSIHFHHQQSDGFTTDPRLSLFFALSF